MLKYMPFVLLSITSVHAGSCPSSLDRGQLEALSENKKIDHKTIYEGNPEEYELFANLPDEKEKIVHGLKESDEATLKKSEIINVNFYYCIYSLNNSTKTTFRVKSTEKVIAKINQPDEKRPQSGILKKLSSVLPKRKNSKKLTTEISCPTTTDIAKSLTYTQLKEGGKRSFAVSKQQPRDFIVVHIVNGAENKYGTDAPKATELTVDTKLKVDDIPACTYTIRSGGSFKLIEDNDENSGN